MTEFMGMVYGEYDAKVGFVEWERGGTEGKREREGKRKK